MKKVVLFTLVAVMAFAVGAYAQRPNFAGKWVLLCFYPGDFTFV